MAVAHRQVASIRNRICRAPRVMRAATCRTRYRKVSISLLARSGWFLNPSSLVQATRSVAAMMISSHGALAVAQFESAELAGHHPGRGVGDERGDPQPVGVGEP